MIRFNLEKLVRFDDTMAAIQTVAESGHARTSLICLRSGQSIKDHRTHCQVSLQILQGSAVVVEEGRTLPVQAGDLVLIAPGARHRVEARGDCAILATLAPHPAREQYPKEHLDRIVPRAAHDLA